MVTEQTQSTLQQLGARLQQAIADGIIYNAEFDEIKQTASNLLFKDRTLQDLLLNSGDGKPGHLRAEHDDYPGIEKLYWALPGFPGGILGAEKKYVKIRPTCPPKVQQAADDYFAVWSKFATLLAQAKLLIVKGRRPSTEPSETDPRTLENTGTCPVCNKNVKRIAGGVLTNHGYTVEHHQFEGGCPGVGFQPWEVSPSGAVQYRLRLERERNSEQVNLERLRNHPQSLWIKVGKKFEEIDREDARYEPERARRVRESEWKLKSLTNDIEYYETRIENWAPTELPGVLAGFDR